MKRGFSLPALLLGVAFLTGPAWWGQLTPNQYQGGRSRDVAARQVRNASSIARMLGEFRTGISDILLVKTERYLHSGIGYAPHITEKVMGAARETEHHDEEAHHVGAADAEHHDHVHDEHCDHGDEDAGTPTLIASPEKDYRGFIGRLHRKVKPWRDPGLGHMHTDGTQILPWFRIATLSDPRHVRGYTIGGYWLSRHDGAAAEAFLLEGAEHNPDAFQLHLMLGQLYVKQARETGDDLFDPSASTRPLLLKARDAYARAAGLALDARPHEAIDDTPSWSNYQEEDAWAAFRMAALTEKQFGSPDAAAALARRIMARAGPEPVLQRIARGANADRP